MPSLQIARFQREREKLYAILDPDERNTAFFKLHLDWFREWGLEKLITDLLKEFPLLPENSERAGGAEDATRTTMARNLRQRNRPAQRHPSRCARSP